MAVFSTTALGPESPLFRGRQVELARLLRLCRSEVTAYVVLYGGRQNGKTSLLLRLEAALRPHAAVCRLDFQLIKGAQAADAFAFLAEQIAQALPLAPDASAVASGPALRRFLSQALARPELTRFVLILDEWGALPAATRETLANALRSLFDLSPRGRELLASPPERITVAYLMTQLLYVTHRVSPRNERKLFRSSTIERARARC